MTSYPVLASETIRPYASFAILEVTGTDEHRARATVMEHLRKSCLRTGRGVTTELVADGLAEGWRSNLNAEANSVYDELDADAFAYRVSRPPSWIRDSADFVDTFNEIVVVARWRRLLAVHCPRDRVEQLQTWLDRSPRPPVRRIAGPVLEQAVLAGEARGLWLRGTHPRRRTKADAKNLVGADLRDALNPLDDSTFALTSGRAKVPEDPALANLRGTVGVTPRKSWVWNGPTESFGQYVGTALDLLNSGRIHVGAQCRGGVPGTCRPNRLARGCRRRFRCLFFGS